MGMGTEASFGIHFTLNSDTDKAIGISSSVAGKGFYYSNSSGSAENIAIDISMPGSEVTSTNTLPAIRAIYGGTGAILQGIVQGSGYGISFSRSVGSGTSPLINVISNNPAGGTLVYLERSGLGAVKGISLFNDTSSNSENVGIEFDLAGGDATQCYAFEFSGSEYIAAATGVSGLTGVIRVLTSDGVGYVPVYSAYS
jgi:hypothetical protein